MSMEKKKKAVKGLKSINIEKGLTRIYIAVLAPATIVFSVWFSINKYFIKYPHDVLNIETLDLKNIILFVIGFIFAWSLPVIIRIFILISIRIYKWIVAGFKD